MSVDRCPICDLTVDEAGPHIHPPGTEPSLRAEMRRVLTKVEQLLDAIAVEEEAPPAPDPAAPLSGFQRFRARQGGQRG